MSYVRKVFAGERARQVARLGSPTGQRLHPAPWWPEEVYARIGKIVWVVYSLSEQGADWHEFTAYDANGTILSVRRIEGY